MAENRREAKVLPRFTVSIWVNGMPLEATSGNDAQVIISQSDGQQKDQASWQKWLPATLFVGLSAFVFASEVLDLVQSIKGNLTVLKGILAALAGFGAGFATSHSGLFDKRKRKARVRQR